MNNEPLELTAEEILFFHTILTDFFEGTTEENRLPDNLTQPEIDDLLDKLTKHLE